MSNLKKYIKEVIEELEEMSVAGSIGGVSTTLGTDPTGKVKYKNSKSSDKKLRSKSKRSIQYILKHGPSKKKRINEAILILTEGRTPRLDALTPEEAVSFLKYLKSEISEKTSFSVSEKISGQNTTIGIEGTASGKNNVYAATKDSLEKEGNVFSYRFFRSKGASSLVKKCFIDKYPPLPAGEKKEFGIEIIKQDEDKPDYVAYRLGRKKIFAAVFLGDFTEQDAKMLSGYTKGVNIKFLSPSQIQRTPVLRDSLSPEIISTIDNFIEQIENFTGRGIKKFMREEIAPKVSNIINSIFGGSLLNPDSPVEGLAVNMQSGDKDLFFKVPTSQFDSIQSIQTSLYSEFKEKREGQTLSRPDLFYKGDRFGNDVRANMIYDFFNSTEALDKRSFGFHLIKFIEKMTEINHSPNTRVFFDPDEFEILCQKTLLAYNTNDPERYHDLISFISGQIPKTRRKKGKSEKHTSKKRIFNWHTIVGDEDYNTPSAQQIKNLNLI